MSRNGRVLVSVLLGCALGFVTRPGLAQPDKERVAQVEIAGTDDDVSALAEALREPLRALGLQMRATRVDGAEEPTADAEPTARQPWVWIDVRHPRRIEILVWAGPRADAGPVRRSIPYDPAVTSRTVAAEEVAYTVRATLSALRSAPLSPPIVPPIVPLATPDAALPASLAPALPAPKPGSNRGFGVDVAAVGVGRVVASSATAFGSGAAVDLAPWVSWPWRPDLWITAAGFAALDRTTTEVGLDTTFLSVRAVPSLELGRVGVFRFAAGVGAGLDVLHISTRETDTFPVTLRPSTSYVDPILETQLVARARLFERLGLLLALTLDYDTAPHHFEAVDASGVYSTLLAPFAVRPTALLGFCVPLGAASNCAGAE